jgi:hypothetical protein
VGKLFIYSYSCRLCGTTTWGTTTLDAPIGAMCAKCWAEADDATDDDSTSADPAA